MQTYQHRSHQEAQGSADWSLKNPILVYLNLLLLNAMMVVASTAA